MSIDTNRIGRVFGDRILVRRLGRPEKVGSIFVPANFSGKQKENDLWYGEIVKFGLDSKYGQAYNLKEGEIIGIESMGSHSAGFEGEDKEIYVWVPEEFVAVKDLGRIAAHRKGENFPGTGLQPVGPYSLIEPEEDVETSKGGIHIPDSARQESRKGVVLEVSEGEVRGSELLGINLKVGSTVVFGRHSGAWSKTAKNFLLLKECDTIAELEKAPELAEAHA